MARPLSIFNALLVAVAVSVSFATATGTDKKLLKVSACTSSDCAAGTCEEVDTYKATNECLKKGDYYYMAEWSETINTWALTKYSDRDCIHEIKKIDSVKQCYFTLFDETFKVYTNDDGQLTFHKVKDALCRDPFAILSRSDLSSSCTAIRDKITNKIVFYYKADAGNITVYDSTDYKCSGVVLYGPQNTSQEIYCQQSRITSFNGEGYFGTISGETNSNNGDNNNDKSTSDKKLLTVSACTDAECPAGSCEKVATYEATNECLKKDNYYYTANCSNKIVTTWTVIKYSDSGCNDEIKKIVALTECSITGVFDETFRVNNNNGQLTFHDVIDALCRDPPFATLPTSSLSSSCTAIYNSTNNKIVFYYKTDAGKITVYDSTDRNCSGVVLYGPQDTSQKIKCQQSRIGNVKGVCSGCSAVTMLAAFAAVLLTTFAAF